MRTGSRWVIVATVAASVAAFPALPAVMPIHWNAEGQADGFASRGWAVAMMPVTMVLLMGLFRWMARQIPAGARPAMRRVVLATEVFLSGVHGVVLAVGLGISLRVERVIPIGICALLAVLGWAMADSTPNRFVGIRTRWTLGSPTVWRRTHRFTAWAFTIGGAKVALLSLLGVSVYWVVAGLLVVSLFPVAYSFFASRRWEPGV